MSTHAPTFSLPQLEHVRIASPCTARWEDMRGDDVRRFCAHCHLHVTNLSAMTREQAEAFVAGASTSAGGRVCVRLYRRADGTVLTRDCPVGVARARLALRRVCFRAAALLGISVAAAQSSVASARREGFSLAHLRPVQWLHARLFPSVTMPIPRAVMGDMVMGKMMAVPPRNAPPPERNCEGDPR